MAPSGAAGGGLKVASTPWIELESIGVQLGKVQALSGISLALASGEQVALVGGNGSGKSTLLRVLHGLLSPTEGRVFRHADLRQAFVFQRPFVMQSSVQTNVALAAWLSGARWAVAKERALAALAQSELLELARRQARTLSGGQQQRLAIARALVVQPKILLLDEPTASLSPQAKREVEALMERCAEQGMGLVFASHNLGQVKRLASRVICLDAGQIVADSSVDDFFNKPLPDAAMRFIRGD